MPLTIVDAYPHIYEFCTKKGYQIKAELKITGEKTTATITCKSSIPPNETPKYSKHNLRAIFLQKGKLRANIWQRGVSSGSPVSVYHEVKASTTGSGYRSLFNVESYNEADLTKNLDRMELVSSPEDALPKPFKFRPNAYEKVNTRGSVFRSTSVIESIHVLGVVTIVNGKIQDDAYRPDATCWFMMEGSGYAGATFTIVTNGEEFYVTERTVTIKSVRIIPSGNTGKATLDLKGANQVDRDLINAAILDWVSNVS